MFDVIPIKINRDYFVDNSYHKAVKYSDILTQNGSFHKNFKLMVETLTSVQGILN